MQVAVIIPFRDRGDEKLLAWTLEGYARQVLGEGDSVEVLVGVDGGAGTGAGVEVERGGAVPVRIFRYERMGAAGVRNRLVGEVRAGTELLVIGNADARPEEGMVRRHIEAMERLPGRGKGVMVLGSAPWEVPGQGDGGGAGGRGARVMDLLLAETPMVFFYSQLKAGGWYDFRHCWTLNVSMRVEDFLAAGGGGGFEERLRPVYYEDLVLGYRMMGKERKGVLYEPGPRVVHRHPTTLEQYLDREELLGVMAPVLGRVCPEAFEVIFGTRDVEGLAREFGAWVGMDGAMHRWIYKRVKGWAEMGAGVLPAEAEGRELVLMTIYQMHVPLKRLAFRLGFLRGMELVGEERWEERKAVGLWRRVVVG